MMFAIDMKHGLAPPGPAEAAERLRGSRIRTLSRGQQPERNEDAYFAGRLCDETIAVCAVADGSGGCGGGREAAQLAIRTMRRRAESSLRPQLLDGGFWRMLMHQIDGAVERDPKAGRTTLAVLVTDGVRAIVTSVGDSLVYHLCADTVTVLGGGTSMVLGTDRCIVAQQHITLRRGDRVLLATDGLWKYLAHPLLTKWLRKLPTDDVLPHMAGELSLRFSGRIPDDATGVLVALPPRTRR
jgi:serine/threonine protein phosphatase PrpC